MSRRKKVLNFLLRHTEKRRLARETSPGKLRSGFEFNACVLFHPPRDARFENGELGVPVHWVQVGSEVGSGVLLYFHGGGYVFGSPKTHRAMLARLAGLTNMRACLPTYHLAPEHSFPAALDDARTTYESLLGTGGSPPIRYLWAEIAQVAGWCCRCWQISAPATRRNLQVFLSFLR